MRSEAEERCYLLFAWIAIAVAGKQLALERGKPDLIEEWARADWST
jgi:hypothetical protein